MRPMVDALCSYNQMIHYLAQLELLFELFLDQVALLTVFKLMVDSTVEFDRPIICREIGHESENEPEPKFIFDGKFEVSIVGYAYNGIRRFPPEQCNRIESFITFSNACCKLFALKSYF